MVTGACGTKQGVTVIEALAALSAKPGDPQGAEAAASAERWQEAVRFAQEERLGAVWAASASTQAEASAEQAVA